MAKTSVRSPKASPAVLASATRPAGALAALSIPGYPRLWGIGLLLNLTRWMTLFLCSYLVNQLTDSTLLVQLVGAALFAPMFLGGVAAGVVADRFDRRQTLLVLIAGLVPVSLAIALLDLGGGLAAWMVYPFALAVGTGLLSDMTSRRSMVYDVVGADYLTNALALEALAMTTGAMLGSLGAGTIISVLDTGWTFMMIAGVYLLALVILLGVEKPPVALAATERRPSFIADLAAGLRYLKTQRTLVSVLGVTVIMNTFYFSFIPLVPIFGDRLHVSAFWASLLLSANSLGSIFGASLIARGLPFGRGAIYVGGSSIALAFLLAFAAAGWYPLALLAMMGAGMAISGFATMQSVLVMISADDDMRGRAMGMLSMSIGALPFAMLLLGGVAQGIGPSAGVILSVVAGLTVMAAWSLRFPEARKLR